MIKELNEKINDTKDSYIHLSQTMNISVDLANICSKYNFPIKGLIDINKANCIIDCSNSLFEFDLYNFNDNNFSIFYIHPDSTNVTITNLNIIVNVLDEGDDSGLIVGVYNTSKNLKLTNSRIIIKSGKSHKIIGFYNNGNLFTHMDTRADNLLINNSHIEIISTNNMVSNNDIYGIYNNLANTISITNNYISAKISGNSDAQKAIGVYTNGRYGRFIGNNIKANGSHPAGLELEQASAYGFINEGLFTIISSNNIIAEWASRAVGIKNNADEALITSNKILTTHNLAGKCVWINGSRGVFNSNILVSTSKNSKMIDYNGSNSSINGNLLEVLLNQEECITGCGIYAYYPQNVCNTFIGNIMFNMKTCGLFVKPDSAIIANNQLASSDYATLEVLSYNQEIKNLLDESHIKTIVRE